MNFTINTLTTAHSTSTIKSPYYGLLIVLVHDTTIVTNTLSNLTAQGADTSEDMFKRISLLILLGQFAFRWPICKQLKHGPGIGPGGGGSDMVAVGVHQWL